MDQNVITAKIIKSNLEDRVEVGITERIIYHPFEEVILECGIQSLRRSQGTISYSHRHIGVVFTILRPQSLPSVDLRCQYGRDFILCLR